MQPSRSKFHSEWTPDDKFVWDMEIREYVSSVVNLRLGTLRLRGSFDGNLTCSIAEMGFTL